MPLKKGDVVLVPFPFTDLSTTKLRPAVVLWVDLSGIDITVCFISSQNVSSISVEEFLIDKNDSEFTQTGLKVTSKVRVSRIVTIERNLITRKLGELGNGLLQILNQKLKNIFVMEEDEDYDVRTDESHWDYVESSSYPYPSFDREEVFIWAILKGWLENNPSLVSLNSIYKKCGNNELKITHSLINSWWDDGAISEDEYYSAMEESKSYCVECLKDSWSLLFEEFESSLPSNFPSFKTDSGS